MADYLGKDVFMLGGGLMQLLKNSDGSIDIAQTSEMVDRYPRERYTLSTKLNAWNQAHDEANAIQLNCGSGVT